MLLQDLQGRSPSLFKNRSTSQFLRGNTKGTYKIQPIYQCYEGRIEMVKLELKSKSREKGGLRLLVSLAVVCYQL